MNIYKLSHAAHCPNDGIADVYEITIESNNAIQVELILSTLEGSPKVIFQEDLTDYLRRDIPAKITTVGTHHGVQITCVRV